MIGFAAGGGVDGVTGIARLPEACSGIVRAFLSGGDDASQAPEEVCKGGVVSRGRLTG
jgi:hypothetical protein